MDGRVMDGPLKGIRVLDLSRVLAGPWATQTLADLGADVIKIERPGVGDDTRQWGPPFVTRKDGTRGDAAYFMCANRGKRSVTVDIAHPRGAALIRAMARHADVLVENFRVGGLKRYGLDHESLCALNPRLVYCSITGFGQDGPEAKRAGYDYMIQAMGGLMSITGQPDGQPGAEPMKVGVAVADLFTGTNAANAILAALFHAQRTGEGQHIDMALFDSQAAMLANQASNWFVSGQPPKRLGNAHPNLSPYQPFACQDGAVVIAVGNDAQFRALCRALGQDDLADDPRYLTNAVRVENRDSLTTVLAATTASMSMLALMQVLEVAGVPCGPVNRVDQVFDEPQARARALIVETPRDDLAEPVRTVASPLRLSRAGQNSAPLPPPALGAHTDEVLAQWLHMGSDEIAALRDEGVI